MVRAPKFTANFNVEYKKSTDYGTFTLIAGDSFNSGYFFEPDNILRQSSYHWVTASLAWTSPQERYTLRAWGANLLDETIHNAAQTSSLGQFIFVGRPKSYGLTFGVTF